MKTETKKSRNLYLQTRNNRWKWMAGATAATAAGVTASQGSTITINLVNNYISGAGGNNLNADLTGDGHPDLTITGSSARSFVVGYRSGYPIVYANARAYLNGVRAAAVFDQDSAVFYAMLGSQSGFFSVTGSIPIFFKDLHINSGAPTKGSLEVSVSGKEIQLDSFTYNSNTPVAGASRAVPDQGSSLAFLAMGAGGVLALRRWRAAKSSHPQPPAQTP